MAKSQLSNAVDRVSYGEVFVDYEKLELKWFDFANWYNSVRIHGSLGYMMFLIN